MTSRIPRVAALELPSLLWQVVLRDRPEWRETPAVLTVRRAGRELVQMASAPALAAGIALGQPLAQARALVPGLAWCEAVAARGLEALRALAEALQALSPGVEPAPPEALLLDASAAPLLPPESAPAADSGTESLSAEDSALAAAPAQDGALDVDDWRGLRTAETRWAEAVLACAQRMGLAARLAIADTPQAARLLAATLAPGECRLVPPFRQSMALAGVPLRLVARLAGEEREALGLGGAGPGDGLLPVFRPDTWALLEELGVQRLARLLELPPRALLERLGSDAEGLQLLARGGRARPLVPYRPPAAVREEISFEPGVADAQGLVFALRPLAERVAARLEGRGVSAARLLLVLETEAPGGRSAVDEQGTAPAPGAGGSAPFAQQAARGGPATPRRRRERLVLEPARPTTQARLLLDLIRDRLESVQLVAPVTGVQLEVLETAQRGEQLRLGERPRALEGLDSALARLRLRLGDQCVGSLQPVPHWSPESAQIVAPFRPEHGAFARSWERSAAPSQAASEAAVEESEAARSPPPEALGLGPTGEEERETGPPGPGEVAKAEGASAGGAGLVHPRAQRSGARPSRLLPPEPIAPAFDAQGRLQAVEWQGRHHRVLEASVPERLVTGWWRTAAVRDYVRVLLGSGAWVWVFRDGDGRWWLHGVFD